MKKVFFALMLVVAAAVSCTQEYDDSAILDRMDQIEAEADKIDEALGRLMERIAAAEAAVGALEDAVAAQDYVVSVVASEDGKGVIVSFKNAESVFIPLDLDAAQVDGVVIADVQVSGDTATFTYTDGTVVTLPLYQEKSFALILEASELTVNEGQTVKVAYEVTGATENTVVDVLAATSGYVAKVTETHVEVTIPSPFVAGEVLVWADNGAGKTSIKKIAFQKNSVNVEEVALVPAEGGEVVIKGVANVDVVAEVVEGADWLTPVASRAEFSFVFTAAANEGEARTAKVALKTAAGELLTTVEVAQAKGLVEFASLVWSIPTPFNGGVNRNMATDGEYIYVAQAGAPAIKAISLNDTNNIVDLNVDGVKGGLLEMSCVRVLPNNDPNVNGGKPVVIATNLSSSGADLTFYLWKDGIDKAPAKQTIGTGARRLGDKFTVRGSYQSGALWFWDFTRADDAMVRFDINNGILGVTWDGGSTYYASGRWAIPLPEVANSTGEVYAHPDATFENGLVSDLLATTNISDGFFVYNGAEGNKYELSAWTEGKDPELDHTYGYNFFEYKGEKYIAYIKLINGRTNATINIIKDINGAADFKGTLEAKEGLVSIQLLEKDGVVAQNGVGDCVVFTREGNTYVAGMLNNNVISLYKLN